MTTTTTRRRHKQPPVSANRQINFINTSVTCNRLSPSKSRLVPLMILLTYSQLLLVSPPMAAKAHRHAANGAALKSILSTRNDDDLLKTRTKETTELGAANNRRHPLLNAGHLNRMYYAPLEQSTQRRHSREDDLRSPNNRGPSLVLSQLDDVVVGHHLKSRPNQLRSEVSHYGERRRDRGDPNDTGVKFERRLLESRPAATPTSWSQPDPRRSYSAPVSRVKLVHASSMRRLYGGGGANAWRSSSANPRRTRFEPMMKRKEDAQASLEGTEASLLLTTTSSSSSGGGGAANASIETTSNDFDHEPLDGAGDSTQQPQLPDDLNEIVPMRPVTGQWRSPIAQKTQKSARLVSTGSQPLVTVIRYVPIIVNVPAALASSVATPASSMKTKTVLLQQQQQQQHHQQQASASESTNQQESNAATGSRGKMPMILASSSDQELTLAGNNDVPAGSNEFAQISGFPGGFSSSHEIQQALSSGLATPASAAELAQLAHAGQPVFARLAYIPLNQPLAQVGLGGAGGHMLPAGASHMTSKALAAYASKLISMLKPSHLLSSLGSGGSGSSQQYQTSQNYNHLQLSSGGAGAGGGAGVVPSNTQHHQQILLLAPSTESILASAALGAGVSTAGHAHRVQPAAQLGLKHAPSEPPARPPDLLINQASGVHSTRSQQQQNQRDRVRQQPPVPLKDQQPRWPLMPQMNGLICVQGLIGTKQPGKTQTLQQSQEQVDLNSFDDEYEPKRPATQQQQQVVVASKGQRQQLPVARGSGERHGKGASSLKPGKGPRAPGAKESPIRMMQQKMASKQQDEQYQQQQQDISEKDFAQISQQKLVGLPSELKRDVIGSAGLAAAQASDRQTTIGQTQPPAPLPASAANFQPGDEIRSDDARGRPIIPFTIRDKIDAPPSVNRAQTGGANNGPVQYDDDGGPADEPAGERGNMGGASEQRRSRTTFVSTGATGARGRGGSGQRVGVDISYKKEKPLAGQRDSSLPVLMASSAPSQAAAASHSPNGLGRETADRFPTPPEFLNSRPPHYPLPRSPAPPRGLHLSSLHEEPIGASSSSSSVSTTTTTTMFAATTGSGETTTAESAPTVPPPREQVLARADFETMARDDSSSLGQLVSSVSLTGSGSSSSSSSAERPLIGTNTLTSTLATPTTNDTVELIVNSTPRETPITASPLDLRPTSAPGEGRRAATGGGGNRSGGPSDQITSSSSTAAAAAAVQSNAAETDTDDDSMLQLMSSNSFSHDRSLTPASERTGASYGRISESLQTNPLDLIDLQNSRSSFELPAQLESLSMLHTDNHDDDRGASSKDNNNNHAHDQLVTQRDKQHAAAAGEQHEREQRSRVLRGALNATASLG